MTSYLRLRVSQWNCLKQSSSAPCAQPIIAPDLREKPRRSVNSDARFLAHRHTVTPQELRIRIGVARADLKAAYQADHRTTYDVIVEAHLHCRRVAGIDTRYGELIDALAELELQLENVTSQVLLPYWRARRIFMTDLIESGAVCGEENIEHTATFMLLVDERLAGHPGCRIPERRRLSSWSSPSRDHREFLGTISDRPPERCRLQRIRCNWRPSARSHWLDTRWETSRRAGSVRPEPAVGVKHYRHRVRPQRPSGLHADH